MKNISESLLEASKSLSANTVATHQLAQDLKTQFSSMLEANKYQRDEHVKMLENQAHIQSGLDKSFSLLEQKIENKECKAGK
jgi:hypothetical protein